MLNGHGDDACRYSREIVSNFSSNVYNQTDLSGLREYLATQFELISSYPHPEAASLKAKIAEKSTVSPDNVCIMNGSVEAIYLIAQAFREKHSAIIVPAFSEYADACSMHSHQITYLSEPEKLDRFDLLWLCNPNNPTGKVYDKDFLTGLIRRYPETIFVIDQAYESFTFIPVFSSSEMVVIPNVILLHSLTKKYAIPGLRLGYVTAHVDLIRRIRMQRMPWSVNSMAIAAGHYLLDLDDLPDMSDYLKEKDRLFVMLGSISDLEILPSDTHFMLIRLRRGKAADLKEFLANEYGILIRDASNFRGLDGTYIRVATQTPEENDILVEAVRKWVTPLNLPKGETFNNNN